MNLDRRLRGAPIRVVDTETTGLSGRDQLVEIAIVQIDALFEPGEPRLLFHSLIDPLPEGPWQGTYAHGLEPRDVVGAPIWADLRERVHALLAEPTVTLCAHHATFDRRFLHSEASQLPASEMWIDTLKIAQRIDATPGRAKLENACRDRGIPLDGHRASNDAIATARLLPVLIREAYALSPAERPPERPTIGQWLEWQRRRAAGTQATDPSQTGLFGPQADPATARARARRSSAPEAWVVRGGVGGLMYCASAMGLHPFRWVHRPGEARRWTDESIALDVAVKVDGRVERVTE